MVEEVPLTEGRSMVFGFLSGSLIAGAFQPYGIGVQIILFIVGVLMFVDNVFAFKLEVHIVSTALLAVIGFIVSFGAFFAGFGAVYLALVAVVTAFLYIRRYVVWKKKHSSR